MEIVDSIGLDETLDAVVPWHYPLLELSTTTPSAPPMPSNNQHSNKEDDNNCRMWYRVRCLHAFSDPNQPDRRWSHGPIRGYKLTWLAGLLEIETWGYASNGFQLVAHVEGAAECRQLKPGTWNNCSPGAW